MTTERKDAGLQDAQVSARYRELAREEPPARLDAAILGAARARAARPGLRRWAVPVSLAAVLVLSVIVTTRIHQEAPDLESGAPAAGEPAARSATPSAPAPAEAKPAARADAAPRSMQKREVVPFVAPPAAAPAPAPAAEAEAARPAARSAAGAAPAAAVAGSVAEPMAARDRSGRAEFEESPQRWLEHIARLRGEGRDAQADESLDRFRRRYPDYKIPEEMRAKVLPR